MPLLAAYSGRIGDYERVEEAIYQAIRRGRVVDSASRLLKKLRQGIREKEDEINQKLTKICRDSRYKAAIQESIVVKKNDRPTIPVKVAYKTTFPGTMIAESAKGLTVYMVPHAIERASEEIVQLKAEEEAETYRLLADLSDQVFQEIESIESSLEAIVVIETIMARGKLSQAMGASPARLTDEEVIHLDQVCHPYLKDPVPLSLSLGEERRGLVITGPNAGGKTVVLKTLGLLQVMTQAGLHIPCGPETCLPVLEQVMVAIGDDQSLENALSTFSAHLKDLADMTREVGRYSLVLVDEIGSGTDPKEGAALANALLENFYYQGSLVVATTHYGEIKAFAQKHPAFETAAMDFTDETLQPTYHLIMGKAGDSHAFWLADKVHLDPGVMDRARAFLQEDLLTHYEEVALVKNFNPQKSQALQGEVSENEATFARGDRVKLLDSQEYGLVYEVPAMSPYVVVSVDGRQREVLKKRLRLDLAAKDLYPEGYDLDLLFMDHESYKMNRDLLRGSKKAYKALKKKAKERSTNNIRKKAGH